ncbi:MAG TPA: RluA family pseudouridine synthase [Polyangiaceae bacterium]|nr:RluA family pseudouridine synthase [Polyangiaceae bacterium]
MSDSKGSRSAADAQRRFIVPSSLAGRPLDGTLRTLGELSWGDARKLIARGKVKIAGTVVVDGERRLRAGDVIEVDPSARRPVHSASLDRSRLVYVDPHVVVVDKPAGISTVPYEPGERGTLDQLVAAILPRAHSKGPPSSLGVVQRLDKETSGLIVFARTFGAKKALAAQLRAHTVHRRYFALAHGNVHQATFRSHIAKNRGDGLRGASRFRNEGQLSVTHVEPIRTIAGATLVACRLETGRTHQIRIHLAEAGHPIVGERVYIRGYAGTLLPAPRPMLHAAELGFVHPVRGAPMKFEAPLPPDFEAMLEQLSEPEPPRGRS